MLTRLRMPTRRTHPGDVRGFTLIEVAVSVAAFSLVLMFAFSLFTQLNRAALTNDSMARSQSGLRAAMDDIQRSLRSAGVDIDYAAGQRMLVHADAFQVAFNANLMPLDDPDGVGFPQALRAGGGVPDNGGAVYLPTDSYGTGAETVVITLDSNDDGVVSAADKTDDLEEDNSNPNDYVVYLNVYGFDGAGNTVEKRPLALVRGPEADPDGNLTPPLFSYWLDHDDNHTTPPILHGDADGDGALGNGEIAQLTRLTDAEMARVERIAVQLTGETANPDPGYDENNGYQRLALASEIAIRQDQRTTAVVFGRIFKDENSNGIPEASEPGIADVRVHSSAGPATTSAFDGTYQLVLPPGQQTITEDDPTAYVSTTSNTLALDLFPGEYTRADFGDAPASGYAEVYGQVFYDIDENGIRTDGERGIANVSISADDGSSTTTGKDGSYTLSVTVGTRVISEVDSTGYVSTTPNAVTVVLTDDGQRERVDFGDTMLEETGTVEGYVFHDSDRDGMRDKGESGIPGATIQVGTSTGESDNQGFFSITVEAGNYSVIETDPPGYTSTTPNTLKNIKVAADAVVTVTFGDMVEEDVEFDVIELAETEHALSIAAADLQEDSRGDPDLMLGTRYSGGTNNLLVWHNNRKNSRTPNSAIFDGTPTFSRATLGDVTSLVSLDFDRNGAYDVVTGFAGEEIQKLGVWLSDAGWFDNSADALYSTKGGSAVLDVQPADFNNDGIPDLAVGVEDAPGTGHFEIWWGTGGGGFEFDDANAYYQEANLSGGMLGSVKTVAPGDFNRDGWADIAVGSCDGVQRSSVHVYLRIPGRDAFLFLPWQSFELFGDVTTVLAVDMVEDDAEDVDLVVATQHWETLGGVELWIQDETGLFGLDVEGQRSRDDWMEIDGSPLSMLALRVDNDVFPDLVIGTRSGAEYQGYVELARTFGYLPAMPQRITEFSIGEVITQTASDFNMDNVSDLAAGTRNSATWGRVYLLYRR